MTEKSKTFLSNRHVSKAVGCTVPCNMKGEWILLNTNKIHKLVDF